MELDQWATFKRCRGIWQAIRSAAGSLPDVIRVRGAPGEEPKLYLLGPSATQLVRKAASLASVFALG
ncbi:MAG: hypothetical protein MZV70_74530 [Desulfobacterales bacterium]|nr:hypothetical protein [Desulfobacterales bacterium]